jgi:cytochrome bd ubiquinol oxidase subunit II
MFDDPKVWLPIVFAGLMGLSILVYVVLDGFDLGVGILFPTADQAEKDRMIASIGPFWDANETWLVLAIGLLLVAFPIAHGQILTALYLPVAIMLTGLIMRGVAFEFRAKAEPSWKVTWDNVFFYGSLITALSQGYMLGLYVMGLERTWATMAFSLVTAIGVTAGYALMGATWLIIKTDGELQRKWFSFPEILLLAPLPLMSGALTLALWISLRHLPQPDDRYAWVPFACAAGILVLAFAGLAYSFYPYIVPDKMTIYEAASSPESLKIILVGTLFVLPVILGYSALSYYVFRGKAVDLRYD